MDGSPNKMKTPQVEALAGMTPLGIKPDKKPLFACQECGKKFYSAASADRAAFGDNGCPKCGGSDIDVYVGN